MAMTNLSPQEIADKYAKNAGNASGDYVKGVQGVKEAPGIKAAKAADKMRQNILKSLDDGRWQKNVAAVSREDWIKATVTKGGSRYSGGVTAAKDKMAKFMGDFLPHLASIQNELESMPNLTLEQNIERMAHQVRRTAEFKKRP